MLLFIYVIILNIYFTNIFCSPFTCKKISTSRKTIFSFSRRPEKMVFQTTLHWNMIFLVLSGKMIFLFPENMILRLKRKMKDNLSQNKIHENMIFSSNFLKRWCFQKGPCWNMIFPVLSGKVVCFSQKHDLFSLGRKWKTAFLRKYMETWCIAQRRKTGNLIYSIEAWPLKFIRSEIFYNE